ncbi:MAG: efflux RND transporter periplasmic adaptor subunit [Cyanobacteria bacterium P01_G01_bin.54]
MALPHFLNPRNPILWLTGLVTGGIVVIGATTYNAFFGPAATILEDYTVPVEVESLQVRVDASGTVVPMRSVNISPNTAGQLQQLLVEQGMPVEEGQRLAIMKNDDVFTQVGQAEARYRQAVADLQVTEQRVNLEVLQAQARSDAAQARFAEAQARLPTEIIQAAADFEAAQERYARAKARFERYQAPTEELAISQNDFDDVALEFRNATAAVQDAESALVREQRTRNPELAELAANAREADAELIERQRTAQAELDSRQAAVALALAQGREAQVNLQDTVITAPFDGIITQKYATQGAFVTPTTSGSNDAAASATSIVALADGVWEVLAKIPEIDVIHVQPGQFVEITADAYPEQTFRGRVRLLAPEAIVEENVTSFEVRIILDPEALKRIQLLPGMNVDVEFLGRNLGRSLVVPTVAIVTQAGEKGVMVPDAGNRPEFRPVKLGVTVEDRTQILEGLQPSDRVFIDLPEQYRERGSAGQT